MVRVSLWVFTEAALSSLSWELLHKAVHTVATGFLKVNQWESRRMYQQDGNHTVWNLISEGTSQHFAILQCLLETRYQVQFILRRSYNSGIGCVDHDGHFDWSRLRQSSLVNLNYLINLKEKHRTYHLCCHKVCMSLINYLYTQWLGLFIYKVEVMISIS